MADSYADSTFVFFTKRLRKINIIASQLLEKQQWALEIIPGVIQGYRTYIFKIKVTDFNLKEDLGNYTVSKLFIPDDAMEEQHQRNKNLKGSFLYLCIEFCFADYVAKLSGNHAE